jgi:hypothetical protein
VAEAARALGLLEAQEERLISWSGALELRLRNPEAGGSGQFSVCRYSLVFLRRRFLLLRQLRRVGPMTHITLETPRCIASGRSRARCQLNCSKEQT